MKKIGKCISDQRGQGTVEYLLVMGAIVTAIVFAGIKFGPEIANFIAKVSDNITKLLNGG